MNRRIVVALVLVLAGAAVVSAACVQGGEEGDRCNPNLSHDECGSSLTCQQPSPCVESYCCPANLATSTSAYCRGDPAACPSEAGADARTEAGTDAGTDTDADGSGGGGRAGTGIDSGPDGPADAPAE